MLLLSDFYTSYVFYSLYKINELPQKRGVVFRLELPSNALINLGRRHKFINIKIISNFCFISLGAPDIGATAIGAAISH